MPLSHQISRYLRRHPGKTLDQIAGAIAEPRPPVRDALSALVKIGHVIRHGGLYYLQGETGDAPSYGA